MNSPVKLDSTFKLPNALNCFHSLGVEPSNKGVEHIMFLRKPSLTGDYTCDEPVTINGNCAYGLLRDSTQVLGFVLQVPTKRVEYDHTKVVVGCQESEEYKPHYYLEAQNALILEASNGGILCVSTEIASPLLIKVEV